MSKVSKTKGKYYPIRRPKERPRDLLKELLEKERLEQEKKIETTRKATHLKDTASSHWNSMDGM